MESQRVLFTLAYTVFTFCFVFTPNYEFQSGIVQSLFSSWLGSEGTGFIQHHVKRTSLTLLLHSALPLLYYMGMCIAAPENTLHQVSTGWRAFLLLSLCLPVTGLALVVHWSRRRWSNHPISRALRAHAPPPHSDWSDVATSINAEFKRVDKFAAGPPGARVVITDTWLLKATTYHVHVALQSDSHLTVTQSRRCPPSPDPASPTQMLTLRVASSNPAVQPFDIRLNSAEYVEARERLRAPIRNAADVAIHQTISDLFLETFRAQVELNQPYRLPGGQDLEPCIGCMQVPAATKLVRCCQEEGCDNSGSGSECQQCFCRPAWCLSCLGRWFASRQDQRRPETWLAGIVSCPTCRAKFCILDVCLVH